MSHLAGFIAAEDIDDFVKAYFEYKSTQAQKIVEQTSKTGKPKRLPRNSHKGGATLDLSKKEKLLILKELNALRGKEREQRSSIG